MNNQFINQFFDKFKLIKRNDNLVYKDVFYFDVTKENANHLLKLVLEGKKKATSSSYIAYQIAQEEIPKVGEYSIVTDFEGTPYCVIETKMVHILPFYQMTFEMCMREGEDDSLESWRKNHIHFFTEEGKKIGYHFDENMLVVFEDFEVVFKEDAT